MIYIIGNAPKSDKYLHINFDDFREWFNLLSEYELDIETTMTNYWCDKELMTIQIGSGGSQCVINWLERTAEQKQIIKEMLEDDTKLKIIHNAQFEYIILKFHGIKIKNIYDTMLAEMVIMGGEVSAQGDSLYSLAAVTLKYLNIVMDKTEQTGFTHEPLTEAQIIYAATDVKQMTSLKNFQEPLLLAEKLVKTFELESDAMYGYADMTFNGIELDTHKWLANLDLVEPVITQSLQGLEAALYEDMRLYQRAVELNVICEVDQFILNWNSPSQRKIVLQWMYPDLELVTKADILKKLKTMSYGPVLDYVLREYTDKNYDPIVEVLQNYFMPGLIEQGFLIPAGVVTINWNSVDQVLPLLQIVEPKLQAMSADDMDKCSHFIIPLITDYKDSLKLKTTYGESFIEKHIEPDGKVRTSYNQIVSTGRCSSRKPNMQNIPAKEAVGTRYRNAFVCDKGWSFVDSDYNSQELVVLAFLSKDPIFDDALRTGKDLHSVCGELVFKDQWEAATSQGCAFYKLGLNGQPVKAKCSCKGHKRLRNNVKTINFGLVYGMSEYKLAASLKISVNEARKLMKEYFDTFPKIKALLEYLAKFGVEHGYIMTIAPYFRKRYFLDWKYISKAELNFHLTNIKRSPELSRIERQSKNMPIQGCSGDITKRALVLTRDYIEANNLQEQVKILLHVHDQITTICLDEIAEWWKPIFTELMEKAAKESIPTGLLTAETNISETWTK